MSSEVVQEVPPHPAASSSHRRPGRARPAQCQAVTTVSSSSSPAVSEERLEPRVEQRDGKYWVLKDKFRTGLNPQEKEPMRLFMEDGIKELAKVPMEQIDANKLSKDDVRLKWLGLFHRRKHQCC